MRHGASEARLNCTRGIGDICFACMALVFVGVLSAIKIVIMKRQTAVCLTLFCFIVSFFLSPSFSSFSFSQSAYAEEIVPQLTRRGLNELPVYPRPKRPQKIKRDKTDIVFDIYKDPEDLMWDRYESYLEKQERRGAERPLLEVFSGADATENQLGLYAGGVTGALDEHLNLKGLRLRAAYGRSSYEYRSRYDLADDLFFEPYFKSRSNFFEALVGYEFRFQKSIFKVYGGVIHERRSFDKKKLNTQINNFVERNKHKVFNGNPRVKFDHIQAKKIVLDKLLRDHEEDKTGAKFLVEIWRDFDQGHWFSGHSSYSTANGYYVAHGRYGLPAYYFIDIGVELGAFGNDEFDALRIGGFSRFKMGDGEWTFSAGLSGDYDEPDVFYGTVQYYTKFYLSDVLMNRFF